MEHDRVDEATFGTSGVESTTRTIPPTRAPMTPQYFFLAGIGAMATALDEADAYYNRFVERGRRVQQEVRQRADDMRAQNATTTFRLRDAFRSAMDTFLDTIDVPSKGDVDTINLKLNILTRKIEDLQMQTGGDAAPSRVTPPPPAPTDLAT